MLKIPHRLLFYQRNSGTRNDQENHIFESTEILENGIPLTFEEIGWVTNVIEPEQQRGPSENP